MKVLITGTSRGIGRACALKFLAEKNEVIGLDVCPDSISGDSSVKNAECYKHFVCDISKENSLPEINGVEILVNNAGITRDGLSFRMKMEDWQNVLNVNLTGTFVVTQIVSNAMLRARAGSIINMSSIVGIHGQGGQVNYAASKGGLIAYSKSLAKEVGARGIRVNCIAPGFIETDMTNAVKEEIRKAWVEGIPLKRAGKPEDVANAALFLASDLSLYVTAQVIGIDGGMGA